MDPLSLLALFGIGFVAIGLIGDSDEPGTETEADPMVEPKPTPPEPEGSVLGTDANDRFDTSDETSAQYFDLQNGNDTVDAGSGNDTIVALGDGSDTLQGGAGDDQIFAGGGFNDIWGGEGDDIIVNGDEGARIISDTEGANRIVGGASNESIYFSAESTVTGGGGMDMYHLNASSNVQVAGMITDFDPNENELRQITVDVEDGDQGSLTFQDLDDGSGVEIYFGDTLLNTVFGASAADLLDVPVSIFMNGGSFTGSDLDDVIRTSEFAETVNGGDGNDHILGGVNLDTGPDLLQGGDGNDTIEARGGRQ